MKIFELTQLKEAIDPAVIEKIKKALVVYKKAVDAKAIKDEQLNARKKYNIGLAGITQFMHGIVNKETSSGFMGFNPVRSMAHGEVDKVLRQFKNPDNVTPEMVSNTRQFINRKASDMLGPKKTSYILQRFDQFIKTLNDYKGSKGLRK